MQSGFCDERSIEIWTDDKKMHETSQMHLMDISRNVIFLFAVFLRRIGYQSAPIVLFVVRPIRISEFSSMFIDFREEMRLKFNFHRRKCRDLSTEIANLQTSGDFDFVPRVFSFLSRFCAVFVFDLLFVIKHMRNVRWNNYLMRKYFHPCLKCVFLCVNCFFVERVSHEASTLWGHKILAHWPQTWAHISICWISYKFHSTIFHSEVFVTR